MCTLRRSCCRVCHIPAQASHIPRRPETRARQIMTMSDKRRIEELVLPDVRVKMRSGLRGEVSGDRNGCLVGHSRSHHPRASPRLYLILSHRAQRYQIPRLWRQGHCSVLQPLNNLRRRRKLQKQLPRQFLYPICVCQYLHLQRIHLLQVQSFCHLRLWIPKLLLGSAMSKDSLHRQDAAPSFLRLETLSLMLCHRSFLLLSFLRF